MQHDEIIWTALSKHFCSFKVKTRTSTFCKNEYNVTGLCNQGSCPLANSRYATILEKEGRCILYIKTVERAHMPKTMWETVKLPQNYTKALEVIDKRLQYWPKFATHKAKQRLTKITQYLIRMRKIRLRTKTRLVGINKKEEKRDRSRERKALAAAKLDRAIEKELLDRLQNGTYDSIYNFPQTQYERALEDDGGVVEDEESEEEADGEDDEEEYEAEYEDGEEDEDFVAGDIEDIPSNGGGDEYDFDDDSDLDDESLLSGDVKKELTKRIKMRRQQPKRRKRVQMEVEYEAESTDVAVQAKR